MKRILSAVLACVLLLGCVFALASCGATPNEDPAEAKAALEAAGYEVLDAESALSMLTYMGITTGVKDVIVASKDDGDAGINIFYCEAEDKVDGVYTALEQFIEAMGDKDVEYVLEKSGTMVWMAASEDDVKAAK